MNKRIEQFGVYYELTNSGVPETRLVETYGSRDDALTRAQQLNAEEGLDDAPFEGAGDIERYTVMTVLKDLGNIATENESGIDG